MKKILSILILSALFLTGIALPQQTFGQIEQVPQRELIPTLKKIADLIFTILIFVSLIFLVWAAILFVTAAGNAEQIEKARHIIFYVIIGLVVAFLAWGIREFLRSYL